MLTSMHTYFLNQGKPKESALDSFLDEQLQLQEQCIKQLQITKQIDERALEISTAPDGKRYDVILIADGVKVTPWLFEQDNTVNVEASYLSQLQFDSSAALTQALQSAPIKTLEWTFIKD